MATVVYRSCWEFCNAVVEGAGNGRHLQSAVARQSAIDKYNRHRWSIINFKGDSISVILVL